MRSPLVFTALVGICLATSGCRSTKTTSAQTTEGGPSSPALDAGTVKEASVTCSLDASTPSDEPPVKHVATEAERAYMRKLRALAHRCKSTHDEIACTEGRLRAMDVSGVHCGHDAVDRDLSFAWAATRQLENATQKQLGDDRFWVEAKRAAIDIDRIDQEPLFLDGKKKDYPISDSYDGNNVIGGAYHIRLRRPWLDSAELARVRAVSKSVYAHGGEQFGLAILRGDTLIAIATGDWGSTASKRLVVQTGPAGLCTKMEDWQIPEDLDDAFASSP